MMFHKILLVDDNALMRECVCRALERQCPATIIEAASGELAWPTLERLRPDLLLTDVALPGALDGLELAKRAVDQLPATAVLVYSADPSYAGSALRAGAQAFLWTAAPSFLDDLRGAVLRALGTAG